MNKKDHRAAGDPFAREVFMKDKRVAIGQRNEIAAVGLTDPGAGK